MHSMGPKDKICGTHKKTHEAPKELVEPEGHTQSTEFNQNPCRNYNNRYSVSPRAFVVLFIMFLCVLLWGRNGRLFRRTSKTTDFAQQAFVEAQRQALIRERLLEHDRHCTSLEVFTKDYNQIEDIGPTGDHDDDDDDEGPEEDELITIETDANKNSASTTSAKTKNTKSSNGRKRSNKMSNRSKHVHSKIKSSNKKDPSINQKKSSTAEPIIYLFALVFVYLLLKAVSDINQHYKSQAKGDKRLRRCSLQSYAQAHKQDRRASKDKPLLARHRQNLMECRSQSVDRCAGPSVFHKNNPTSVLKDLRKYSSIDEQQQQQQRMPWRVQMLEDVRNMQDLALDSDKSSNSSLNQEPSALARRCSVPSSMLRQKLSSSAALNRRTSVALGNFTPLGGGSVGESPEVRRRVRMINRH